MSIKTYKTLIILLRLDKWSYIFNGLFIAFVLIFLEDKQVLITSLLLAHVILRKVIVTYLRKKLAEKTPEMKSEV